MALTDGERITFIDLFAGIGGMRRGFEALGAECVFTSERDSKAVETYVANFCPEIGDVSDPRTLSKENLQANGIFGDITKILRADIPRHDVLLAGFPCQPFSLAGVSKKNALGRPHGFDCEHQGNLFFEIERILRELRPRAFLLENVKHLENHDGRKTFNVIWDTLAKKLEYHVYYKVVDASGVVPQRRKRIFIVGFRDPVKFNFKDVSLPEAGEGPRLSTVLHPQNGGEPVEAGYTYGSRATVLEKYTLSEKLWEYLRAYADKHRAKGNGFGYGLVGPDDVARTLSARYYKDGSEILVRTEGPLPRRLTPRECARLMGFDRLDAGPEQRFRIPVSDTQAYKQFGNAVVPKVVEAIGRAMLDSMLQLPLLNLDAAVVGNA